MRSGAMRRRTGPLPHRPAGAALLAVLAALAASPAAAAAPRPNIVVVVLDDVRPDGIDRMPVLLERIAARGVTFRHAFAPNASCAPSRASLLTGLSAARHGVLQVAGPLGGARRFRESGADRATLATWLQAAGYRTGFFGKYLNAYALAGPPRATAAVPYVPPGWLHWWALASPEHYGGRRGMAYRAVAGDRIETFGDHTSDAQYSTRTTAAQLRAFVADAVRAGTPFVAWWTPLAAHGEQRTMLPVPEERFASAFDGLAPWRPPGWNEAEVRDKPRWVRANQRRPQARALAALIDRLRRRQYQTLLSVDEQLGALLDELAARGVDEDTIVVVTSDHGIGWGEHQLWGEKGCAYEACQRVPLLVRYPRRVAGGRVLDIPALNVDLAPTLAALAGIAVPPDLDGRDLSPWLVGGADGAPRTDYLLDHWRLDRGDTLRLDGAPADGTRVRLFFGDTRRRPRPSRLFELDVGDGVAAGAIAVPIGADDTATLTAFAAAVRAAVPGSTARVDTARRALSVSQPPHADARRSVYFWPVTARGGAVVAGEPIPDYLGVRDVAGGFTWVEYETGERELYDLTRDPYELVNRAADPAYRAVRARLAQRLRELRARGRAG